MPASQRKDHAAWLAATPWKELLVGLAALGGAWLSIKFTRVPGSIALFWPTGTIAAGLLLRLPKVRWSAAWLAVLAAILIANTAIAHRPWLISCEFAAVNGTEVALMVVLFRCVWSYPYPALTIGQATMMTLLFGIAIPGVCALVGGLLLFTNYGTPFATAFLRWWSSHAIGACMLGPVFMLFSLEGLKRLARAQYLIQNLLIVLLCLLGSYVAVAYIRFPFICIGLLLLLVAFRLGGFGASLVSLAVGLLITTLWLLGIRPLGLDPRDAVDASLLGLPVIALLATLMPPIAVGLGSDARRASARALRVSERWFRDSMEHSPTGMLVSDLNGIWAYTNLALQEMLGYTAEEFRQMPPGGPSKPEDWILSEARWSRLLSGEINSYSIARRFQHKNGTWVWTNVTVSVMRDDSGKAIHLISQIESLEARRRAEGILADERERLKITLASIHDAVITTDSQLRITYVNAAAESLLGVSAAAAQLRRVDEVIHLIEPQTSKAVPSLIAQCVLRRTVSRREQICQLHRSDGSICYVTDVVSPILDSAGELSGLVLVFHDETSEADRALDLEHRATHDALTGLVNRAEFQQRLRDAFAKARHLERPSALLAIDLDRFKAVNDTAGHAAGDALLRKVAEACRLAVRASDTVARLGGDEFAIILDNCTPERVQLIALQILQSLNPLSIEWENASYSIGASIGVAMNTSELGDELAWLKSADQACYLAKRDGRGVLKMAPA